ncbi:MAG TPA: endonuclease/exonuclease/phosphatase family protein, partial [Cellulomonas sp.]|nr:endonuclease/exonuclease/phosphatase family protein [Cellulomonas sp.]
THVSEPERIAFSRLLEAGLSDVVRPIVPSGYTYWDYQQLRFPKNMGMRIDLTYASPALAARVTGVTIERNERKGKQPSDHVPVVLELAD